MSISVGQNKCSSYVELLRQPASNIADRISNRFETENITTLSLGHEELACVLPFLLHDKKILVIIPKATQKDAHLFSELSKSFGTPMKWHLINDSLSDQETEGSVITALSEAYYALAAPSPSAHIVSSHMLAKECIDVAAYQAQTIRFTQGENVSLSSVSKTLVERGFIRHRNSLEKGSFRIQGEVVTIQHPSWDFAVAITFSGNTIEKITSIKDSRIALMARITVPLMKFPNSTTPWKNIAAHALVARSHDQTAEGEKTLVLHDSRSDVSFLSEERNAVAALARCLTPTEQSSFDKPLTYEQAFELIGSLQIGKPAVHIDHGIGVFEGLQRREILGQTKEYLVLRYAQGDAVSVPVEFAHKVTPYVGDSEPTIHRLHGTAWKKARKAAQVDAVAFAKDLLSTAGKRSDVKRNQYHFSDTIEEELNQTFPHDLTDDQLRTWFEVRDDMKKDVPMDRLVVGDVGFGKTEIAYRAARHAIANNKQVAILAPTTLLVQQHYDLFSARLPKEAGSVHLMSRFTTKAEQKQAQATAASGEPTIIVGTHALLSPKMNWKNLALVVIDEEQRFGVKQKEQLKKIRSSIDVLSLSATPIPRTLSMALSGLRSLSLIATAPAGRKSVETFVGKLTEDRLRNAVQQELDRGGQVYAVAPKIRQLGSIQKKIHALFPDSKTAIAHGRLSDTELSAIVHQFDAGQIDVLISSSIVEHGLDLPGANTMIVFYAPHFGLSELYQLRGRIGRRTAQGYAHFFYEQEELTPIQRERLTALTEASRLGSGWELARRDLEIRGAGNMLGAEQSGSVNSVGVQLYLDMVRQVATGEEIDRERADITVPLPALLPVSYIEDADQRTEWYIRLTRAQTAQELEKRVNQLAKKFGELPEEADNLILTLKLQHAATKNNIQKIHTEKISPPDEDPYDRLVIDTTNAPTLLGKLSSIGNWRVRGNSLTWDTDEVTKDIIHKLIQCIVQ